MADVKFRPEANGKPDKTPQQKAKAERLRIIRQNETPPTIKVYASSTMVHGWLRHPNGTRFRGEFGTATDWPLDSFTRRRLRDGAISTSAVTEQGEPDPSMGVRDAARARAARVREGEKQQQERKPERSERRAPAEPAAPSS